MKNNMVLTFQKEKLYTGNHGFHQKLRGLRWTYPSLWSDGSPDVGFLQISQQHSAAEFDGIYTGLSMKHRDSRDEVHSKTGWKENSLMNWNSFGYSGDQQESHVHVCVCLQLWHTEKYYKTAIPGNYNMESLAAQPLLKQPLLKAVRSKCSECPLTKPY